MREHNWQVDRLHDAHPNWGGGQLYEEARAIVTAELANITYTEFLPKLVGDRIDAYTGYKAKVDATISVEFAGAAFRFGHSIVSGDTERLDNDGNVAGPAEIPLRDAFFMAPDDFMPSAAPTEAFKIATGVDLLDVMRLGARIIKRSTDAHQVRFTRDELLADGAAEGAIDLLFANMARPLDDYRVELQGDRDKGAIGNQRYTLTRFPFLAVDDNTFVMLRHQWALDRLCGGQLYFEAWASFSSGGLRNRFKNAMCDAFEVFAGGILHRIFDKCPHLRAIADENEMQAAWTEQKGETPSVCDWIIFGKGHCIVIDATNRAVKEDAAQGLASWDEYSADVEAIFTNTDHGKFGQLLSTIDLVKKHGGWGNEKVDTTTMYAPLIVVPDAGVVNGLLTQFDINIRGVKAFGHLQPQVYAPGIVPISDIQLLEGFADIGRKYGKNPDMMDMIAKSRTGASKYGLASLQLFLLSQGSPILPVSDHIVTNSRKVIRLLKGS